MSGMQLLHKRLASPPIHNSYLSYLPHTMKSMPNTSLPRYAHLRSSYALRTPPRYVHPLSTYGTKSLENPTTS